MATPVVAVDFGASSIRVCRVDLDASGEVVVVHRYEHGPVRDRHGVLRWDWLRLVTEMERGLTAALELGPVASIGIDTWGVDYGLLDERGDLVEPPVSYRDAPADGALDVVRRIGAPRLYEIAGLPPLAFNTIFRLASHDRALVDRAAHVLLLPELLVHHLTGAIVAERTSAGTTGLLDLATGAWSGELLDAIGIEARQLATVLEPGTRTGAWRGVPVHLVAGHDTASAVAAAGAAGSVFVASGTWLLVGREQPEPDTSDAARRAGLANEQAAGGGVRLLRNVAGWWLVDECRRQWADRDLDALLAAAGEVADPVPLVDATDPRFVAPPDMEAELLAASGLAPGAGRATVVRCAIESMAAAAATVVATLPVDGSGPPGGIRLFGGGARSPLLADALARHTRLPVSRGPAEATALGNALVQGVAIGRYDSLDSAREAMRAL